MAVRLVRQASLLGTCKPRVPGVRITLIELIAGVTRRQVVDVIVRIDLLQGRQGDPRVRVEDLASRVALVGNGRGQRVEAFRVGWGVTSVEAVDSLKKQ